MDYLSTVAKVNQIISAEIVRGYQANFLSIDDSNIDKHSSFNTAHNSNNAKLTGSNHKKNNALKDLSEYESDSKVLRESTDGGIGGTGSSCNATPIQGMKR